jgi:protein-S-isoprenylcysteine O-methyltransferase Ste14
MKLTRNTFTTLIKTIIFSILVPGSVTVFIPYLLLSNNFEVYSFEMGVIRYLGIIPIMTGILFYFWSALDFALIGKGTPAPIDPPRNLVIRGPYHYVRNPMYAGGILILIGEALLFGSAALTIYTFFIWLAFHLFIVLYEEPHLRKRFGPDYEAYTNKVPRWIPGMKKV